MFILILVSIIVVVIVFLLVITRKSGTTAKPISSVRSLDIDTLKKVKLNLTLLATREYTIECHLPDGRFLYVDYINADYAPYFSSLGILTPSQGFKCVNAPDNTLLIPVDIKLSTIPKTYLTLEYAQKEFYIAKTALFNIMLIKELIRKQNEKETLRITGSKRIIDSESMED